MRVLLISQEFPPKKTIATVRIAEVANQFAKAGYETYAVTSNNYKYRPTDKFEVDERIKVIRSDSWDFLIFWDRLKRLKAKLFGQRKPLQAELPAPAEPAAGRTNLNYRFAEILVYYLPFSLIFGEGSLIYILVTFFKCLPYTKGNTVIFTSFRAYSDHLIAFLLKLARPDVIWICDFRDSHVPPNSKGWLHRYQNWLNRAIFRKANVVTAVSRGVLSNLRGYNKNMKLLRNGIVGELSFSTVQASTDSFNIVYTGALYNGTRNPSLLFTCLKRLLEEGRIDPANVKIIYAGPDDVLWKGMITKHGLDRISEIYGMLAMQESRRLQDSASINLLLTWCDRDYKGVLTGKMYEYFKARKPILTLVNGERDEEIEEIMQLTNAGPVLYDESSMQELEDFLLANYQAFLSKEEPKLIDETALQQFQWNHYFPKFLKEIGLQEVNSKAGQKALYRQVSIDSMGR